MSRPRPLTPDLLGYRVHVAALRAPGLTPEAVAEKAARHAECGATVVAGVPEGASIDACTVAVAYLHALEARARGSRVRSLPLLFLMELLGYRQVRDVVEAVNNSPLGLIVVVGLDGGCVEEAITGVGGEPAPLGGCDPHLLSTMVARSVLQGPRLE